MCGFTGFLAPSSDFKRSELQNLGRRMADTIRHRGPDDHEIWIDDITPLVFAFRRLAIIDLSPEGRQPMKSFSGRYMIIFNGEIYNFLGLRKELERANIYFHGRSDTEVLLAAVETWGLNQALQKISGMFAFALYDRKENKLHFARDRLGKKPLYIGWAKDTFVFGSELKTLRAHPDFQSDISPQGLQSFLQYGYVPAPGCIYKNAFSLPAGFRLTLDISSLKSSRDLAKLAQPYWHHTRVLEDALTKTIAGSDEAIINEFESILEDCVRERMVSDVPLGAFLSGGIDSSTIVALMQQGSTQPVKTYTIGFDEEGFDEAQHAKKIAAHLGTDHHELYLSAQDALNVIPSLPDIYDEPFADISAIPTYLVSKFAREDVTVALSGDGGDEMLGGYNRHISGPGVWNRKKFIPKPIRHIIAETLTKIPTENWDKILKSRPHSGMLVHKTAALLNLDSQEAMYENLLSQWKNPPVKYSAPARLLMDESSYQPPDSLSFAEKMMYWDTLFYLPNDILTKVDRASMAVSLEARAPLLDQRIYEYAWRLPQRFKIRNGQGKWLLRQVLKRHVPKSLFERPKQGFSVPVGVWLRGPLRDWAENLLSEQALSRTGLLDPAPIRQAWAHHLAGHGYYTQKLWGILMFQAWQQRWR